MSLLTSAMQAAKMAVKPPMKAMTSMVRVALEKSAN